MHLGQSALLIGATGATGKYLLKDLLSSPHFTRVGEYGRRITPLEQITSGKEKLEQKTINFEQLEDAGLKAGRWDVVFVIIGSSARAAGSAAAFEKVDREYVVNVAQAAKTDDENHSQRLVYLSSQGANASSTFLYFRSKGLTELALADSGYNDTIVMRPLFLRGGKSGGMVEAIAASVSGFFALFSNDIGITRCDLARSMRIAGQVGSSALPPLAKAVREGNDTPFTVIGNRGAVALAKTEY